MITEEVHYLLPSWTKKIQLNVINFFIRYVRLVMTEPIVTTRKIKTQKLLLAQYVELLNLLNTCLKISKNGEFKHLETEDCM